ncbi:MAG: hypothetical protein J6Z47_08320 [Bacteroidales bacterium]|nr:hypothetical protein [Bacteroidales bacterium]
MNIIVKTAQGRIIVRPDTTWEKDNADFFPPDFVEQLTFSPVLFARILKPGRSVSLKFASRYYDAVNFGVLLYPENLIDEAPESFATASCLDHTSFLPVPMYNPVTLGAEGNSFILKRDGETVFEYGSASRAAIEEAISEATRMVYIRTGDLIAIELDSRKMLCERSIGRTRVTGSWCSNPILDFNIVF